MTVSKELPKFRMHEFPIDKIPFSSSWMVIGGPGSGKTTFILDMVRIYRSRYPIAVIMSGSEDSNGAYERVFPKLYIHDGFDLEAEDDYIVRQKRCKINGCKNGGSINIIDDCSDNVSKYKSKTFEGLLKNGSRHWNDLFITGLQYGVDIKPGIRKCASYIALFYEPDIGEREKLYKHYGGPCGSFQEFSDIMEQMVLGEDPSDKFTCMIIKRLNRGMTREENVFYYKADYKKVNKGFKFGCKEYLDWDKTRRDPKKCVFSGV